jgi:hypothetical protein
LRDICAQIIADLQAAPASKLDRGTQTLLRDAVALHERLTDQLEDESAPPRDA